MTEAAAQAYRARFVEVLDYVDRHLEEALPVEQLCGVAAFSKFHFHRQFSALFGLGVHEYVQLQRLKRASYELAFRRERRVIDLYSEWLPESGEQLRDFPLFLQRIRFFPDVAEHVATTDIFLPLA